MRTELVISGTPQFDDGSSLYQRVVYLTRCEQALECGGRCVLADGHVVPCECAGDDYGCPGTCPA